MISNGVINLCPDKATVLAEAYRVLKPGGRLQIADIVVAKAVPDGRESRTSRSGPAELPALSWKESFSCSSRPPDSRTSRSPSHRYDTFSDAPSASSAAEFGTQGVDIRALKPC